MIIHNIFFTSFVEIRYINNYLREGTVTARKYNEK